MEDLWKRRDKLAEELDWLYEYRKDQLTKKVTRQLIAPHLADKHRQRVRIYLHHLRTKPRRVPEKPYWYQRGRQVLVLAATHRSPQAHAYYQDLIENLGEQHDALQKVHDFFRAGM